MTRSKGITGSTLKMFAILAMTCNHVAHVFGESMPAWLCFVLYSIGGMTFPIMAFLLVEGFRHTSSLRNYALRLGAAAIVAQIPFSLLWGATANVLFTLLISLGMLWVSWRYENKVQELLALIGAVVVSFCCDWGMLGPLLVFSFWKLGNRNAVIRSAVSPPGRNRDLDNADLYSFNGHPSDDSAPLALRGDSRPVLPTKGGIVLTMSVAAMVVALSAVSAFSLNDLGYALIGFSLAALLLCGYRGQRGMSLKWFYYAYYPGHLFLIYLIAMLV